MDAITLDDWIKQLKSRFDERELKYLKALKAKIYLQLKDRETGELHLHEFEYVSKEAEALTVHCEWCNDRFLSDPEAGQYRFCSDSCEQSHRLKN